MLCLSGFELYCLGALGNESIHEDNLGDDTPFINNNLTLLGSEIRFTQ